MKTIRFYRWSCIILLASNLFFLFQLKWHHGHRQHPPRLSHVLHAKDAQAKKLDAEMQLHRKQVLRIRLKQLKIRRQLLQQTKNNNLLRSQLLSQIAQQQRILDSITVQHFDRVSALCTAKQRQELKQFQLQILHPRP